MKVSMVMTVIGRDRPGLVESLAALIEEHSGNWEESRMVQLGGEFAGLLQVRVPTDTAGDLERALGKLEGMTAVVARSPEIELSGEVLFLELEVVGQDHPGIVHRIAGAVAARGISIEEFESEVGSAPMTGQKMFQAKARLRAPSNVDPDDLTRDLEDLAADLMVELRLATDGS